jgi:hypothetical protein
LSETALGRLRRKIETKLAQEDRGPSRRDLDRLRREIESLDRKIDRGAERVLEAPDDLLPTIYRKLQELRSDRDRLKAELQALTSRGTRSGGRDGSEVDRVIEALRSLGAALQKANPADTKRLLASIVTKIELHFTEGTGKQKRDFSHGTIYIRPDAGENRDAEPGSDVTHMSRKRPYSGTAGAAGILPSARRPARGWGLPDLFTVCYAEAFPRPRQRVLEKTRFPRLVSSRQGTQYGWSFSMVAAFVRP